MREAQRKTPGGNRGQESARAGGYSKNPDYSPLAAAAAKALARELSIIMLAADRLAAGHGLAWSDYDRLHQAHQHILTVLADMTGKEVLQ